MKPLHLASQQLLRRLLQQLRLHPLHPQRLRFNAVYHRYECKTFCLWCCCLSFFAFSNRWHHFSWLVIGSLGFQMEWNILSLLRRRMEPWSGRNFWLYLAFSMDSTMPQRRVIALIVRIQVKVGYPRIFSQTTSRLKELPSVKESPMLVLLRLVPRCTCVEAYVVLLFVNYGSFFLL